MKMHFKLFSIVWPSVSFYWPYRILHLKLLLQTTLAQYALSSRLFKVLLSLLAPLVLHHALEIFNRIFFLTIIWKGIFQFSCISYSHCRIYNVILLLQTPYFWLIPTTFSYWLSLFTSLYIVKSCQEVFWLIKHLILINWEVKIAFIPSLGCLIDFNFNVKVYTSSVTIYFSLIATASQSFLLEAALA